MDKNQVACVYIMTNVRNSVLYTGVTNDLIRRVLEHKSKKAKGFTKLYNIDKLVYYEATERIEMQSRARSKLKAVRGETRWI